MRETVEEGGGNRRGGKIAPLTPALHRRVSRAFKFREVARASLSLSVAAICQCRQFLRRRWRQFSKLEAVIAPYFIASSKQRLHRELRGPFLAMAGIIINGRPNRALCYTTAFFLPSFLSSILQNAPSPTRLRDSTVDCLGLGGLHLKFTYELFSTHIC